MVDREVLPRRVREIDRRVAALRSVSGHDRRGFLEDLDVQAQAERHLQIAPNAASQRP